MANPNPTRLSPAELRRRLLAPPTEENLTVGAESKKRRFPRLCGRFPAAPMQVVSASAQPSLDLDALSQEASLRPS
jgi:hypothetical protein